ncbi:hypothetical protein JTE90_007816 [Oedothorax gibbosus]|uniref:Uncharacterized protein n=1 Tax=Oedothorax gibbosus TaxID=931172 RepID=A0AAV6VKJ0_9ARAC|nr:hypothetical protein JTE90_007816 [Oedothorax gibbosus]
MFHFHVSMYTRTESISDVLTKGNLFSNILEVFVFQLLLGSTSREEKVSLQSVVDRTPSHPVIISNPEQQVLTKQLPLRQRTVD